MAKIKIKGKEYPLKCTCYVLAIIQDKYENLTDFEIELSGKKPFMENGEQKKDEKGNLLYKQGEPSMKAINFMLPLCVNEGIEIEAEELNTEAKPLKEKYINRNVEGLSIYELSKMLCEEFYRAVIAKK
ncbi:MAG: hypothetical protein KBT03_06100 [Bacteroidales bacterium]|nr:hypothetical protein [Candidatus Scybalousia scybalohippi]